MHRPWKVLCGVRASRRCRWRQLRGCSSGVDCAWDGTAFGSVVMRSMLSVAGVCDCHRRGLFRCAAVNPAVLFAWGQCPDAWLWIL